jgi:transposase
VVGTYVGIDVHKNMCHAIVMSQEGSIIGEKIFSTNAKVLEAWVRTHPKDYVYAMESGTPTKRLYWVLKEMGREVHMAHPTEVRRMMGTKKKTDREDSAFLADLLRMNRLPKSYVPDPEANEERQLLRYRMDLAKKVIAVKNQIHAILTAAGVPESEFTDVFGREGLRTLHRIELQGYQKYILDCHLRQFELLNAQIEDVMGALAKLAQKNPAARTLMQIKGIDFYSALVILNEIGDVTRFPTAKHLTSYAGLVPRIYQSGNISRTGHIHKQGPKALRTMMVRCAAASVRGPGKFQRFYERKRKQIGHGKAIVAVARKMLAIVFTLLTRGCEYEERDDRNVHKKMRIMERKAKALPDIDLDSSFAGLPENARQVLRGETGIWDLG